MYGDGPREKLPGKYEKLLKSETLKEHVADIGLWGLIPVITYNMNSRQGIRRLDENRTLFEFIDQYFPEGGYDFEPNMQDGRYVMLPDDVYHQGIGILASKDYPGCLDVGHFWYPIEFASHLNTSLDQVYVCMYIVFPGSFPELGAHLKELFAMHIHQHTCTFPFSMELIATLEGPFLDNVENASKTIREVLKNASYMEKRNGEGLINFMNSITRK